MASTVISESELLDALASAMVGTGPTDARTSAEIRQELHIGEKRLLRALRLLEAEGRIRVVEVLRRSLIGRPILVPGYLLVPKQAKRRRG